jgi:hypothetical protein
MHHNDEKSTYLTNAFFLSKAEKNNTCRIGWRCVQTNVSAKTAIVHTSPYAHGLKQNERKTNVTHGFILHIHGQICRRRMSSSYKHSLFIHWMKTIDPGVTKKILFFLSWLTLRGKLWYQWVKKGFFSWKKFIKTIKKIISFLRRIVFISS